MTGAVYLLDKQPGVTSRKAASQVAAAQGFRKYGHCGTLDPDASGLLIILLGKATRLAPYISGETKRYSFDLVTGVSTDTLDMSGTVLERWDTSSVTAGMVVEALTGLTGAIEQQVPAFSAVRVGGKRGYKLARRGIEVKMPVRKVTVSDWESGEMRDGRIQLKVTVSSGTYIRALARDIGSALGIPAVADRIRRLRSGAFSVQQAAVIPDSRGALLTMREALMDYPHVVLSPEEVVRVSHGMSVQRGGTGAVVLLDGSGAVAAMGRGFGHEIRPVAVFVSGENR